MGGVYRIQTFFGFLYFFYIYKAPKRITPFRVLIVIYCDDIEEFMQQGKCYNCNMCLQSSLTILIAFSRPHIYVLCHLLFGSFCSNCQHISVSYLCCPYTKLQMYTNSYKKMLYTSILLTCTKK